MAGVITASEPSWTAPFTGPSPRQFARLITALRREGPMPCGGAGHGRCRFQDRVLPVAVYRRTSLTLRQLALPFGVSKSAADRSVTASSKNYRYSTNHQVVIDAGTLPQTPSGETPTQAPSGGTPTVVAVGKPGPGNRHDCRAWEESGAKAACGHVTVIADRTRRGHPGHCPREPLPETQALADLLPLLRVHHQGILPEHHLLTGQP